MMEFVINHERYGSLGVLRHCVWGRGSLYLAFLSFNEEPYTVFTLEEV